MFQNLYSTICAIFTRHACLIKEKVRKICQTLHHVLIELNSTQGFFYTERLGRLIAASGRAPLAG